MRLFGGVGSFVCVLLVSGIAGAEPDASQTSESDAPPARVGFQMAVRTGFSLPMGNVSANPGADMSEFFSGQVPLFFDIGGKVIPNLFVGGYLGLGFGGTAGNLRAACDASNATCTT